jgi:hypothetical protein
VVDKTGFGLTVITKFVGVAEHKLILGVTTYVTEPIPVPGLVSVWAIVAPLPGVAPVIPPTIVPMVQVYVVPATLLSRAMFVAFSLHIVVELAVVTLGVGSTVITTAMGEPAHNNAPGAVPVHGVML